LKKKERDGKKKKRKKEGRTQFVIIITLLFMIPITQHYFLPFALDRESSDIVIIIKRNIFFKWL